VSESPKVLIPLYTDIFCYKICGSFVPFVDIVVMLITCLIMTLSTRPTLHTQAVLTEHKVCKFCVQNIHIIESTVNGYISLNKRHADSCCKLHMD
jgi:hypothetical protein